MSKKFGNNEFQFVSTEFQFVSVENKFVNTENKFGTSEFKFVIMKACSFMSNSMFQGINQCCVCYIIIMIIYKYLVYFGG